MTRSKWWPVLPLSVCALGFLLWSYLSHNLATQFNPGPKIEARGMGTFTTQVVTQKQAELGEAGFWDACSALLTVEGKLPESLFDHFTYVTVVSRPAHHGYVVSFSNAQPDVRQKNYDHGGNEIDFAFRTDLGTRQSFWLIKTNGTWEVERTQTGDFTVTDRDTQFHTELLQRLKSLLLVKN